jgi:hypothetical protein
MRIRFTHRSVYINTEIFTLSTDFSTVLFHILHRFVHKTFGGKCGKTGDFFDFSKKTPQPFTGLWRNFC